MTAQYPDYEISAFLVRRQWTYDNDDQWTSPALPLVDHLERVKSFNPLVDIVEARQIIETLKSQVAGDGIEELDRLCKILPDVYDLRTRWTLEIKDRVPLIRFTLETELALDIAGYNAGAEEAYRLWHQIEIDCEGIGTNDDDSIRRFRDIGRSIWKIWKDDTMRNALGWGVNYFSDIFREEEIDQLIRRPIVYTRLDMRGNNTTQKNRFQQLLELDSYLPEKDPLLHDSLSDITQYHRKQFFQKETGLLPRIKAGKISHEDALLEYDAILLEDREKEEKIKMTLTKDGRSVYLDGKRFSLLPEVMDELVEAKYLSRHNQKQVNFVFYLEEGYAVASTDDGFSDEKIKIYIDKEDERLLQFLQERGDLIR